MPVLNRIAAYADDMTAWRRHLHQHPELQFDLTETAAFVAERLREGFEVAMVGAPNAGKSTLLNRLAGREAAITSEVAGTTRDVIEVRMDLAGLPVTLLDTAGLREAEGVEAVGVERGRARAEAADRNTTNSLGGMVSAAATRAAASAQRGKAAPARAAPFASRTRKHGPGHVHRRQ